MSEGARHRQRARAYEQRESWKRAIEEYEHAIQADRLERRDVDLALYNRIGDLYRRVGDVNKAVNYYELAADGHLAAGYYNNAIALCNKILRNQPNRHSAYLKLGKIGAAKGFLSDARRHFLEFAELLVTDALARPESSGGHFREESQTEENEAKRDDENYAHVAAWEFKGVGEKAVLHKEPLEFENVQLTTRSYK